MSAPDFFRPSTHALTVCVNCRGTVAALKFCTDCGAPLEGDGSATAGSDAFENTSAFVGELFPSARATHDYKEVELVDEQPLTAVETLAELGLAEAAPRRAPGSVPAPLPPIPKGSVLPSPASLFDAAASLPAPTKAQPATWGARGRVRRLTGGIVRLQASNAEREHAAAEQLIRQSMWSRPVHVAVVNPKGGVGKSPVSLITGNVLAAGRGGSVAVFEGTETAGSLARIAEGTAHQGLSDLIPVHGQITSHGQLGRFVAAQTSGADVIGSLAMRSPLTAENVNNVLALLDRFYRITVVDTGNNPFSASYGQVVAQSDALVVPVVASMNAVVEAGELLNSLARSPVPQYQALAATATVVVVHDGRPEDQAVTAAIRTLADSRDTVRTVLDMPFDPHIALGREISLASLSTASRRAWVAIAAELVAVLNLNVT